MSIFLRSCTDQHAQMFRLFDAVGSPDGQKKGSMRDHPAGVPRQIKQKFKFLGRQPDFDVLYRNPKRIRVDLEVADGDGSLRAIFGGLVRARFLRTRASNSSMPTGLVT